ncbi:protein KINASE OF THE OUTER CHLOROPLAST MEMBRANE 1 [Euphorbia lathyris]|uniref:protein KINASE OF THE OUTER CHLOROPLAST MEMBRANE 1 n=1 Tax=Euphorbia lathyris TaxID=212925 RepID=UPI0033130F0E
MAGKVDPAATFEYELFEGDPDNLRTVVASPNESTPWIDPANLKLRHRIGRGSFGDVWLATHHQSTQDYDEYHEVAVKMLHPVKEDHLRVLFDKFDDLFLKCKEIGGVSLLYGISIINGKIGIVMKFYEGSIGDKMARLKGGKLSLADVLRYGIELARGILALHEKELLALNLKPSNFLLNDNDQAILGDVGIPFLLLGIPLSRSDMSRKLGTPNYMAPEQWQPEARGPLSVETDSWGFACSILEIWTGIQPWRGKTGEEIYDLVVRKQEKPQFPEGFPPPIENVLRDCFDYDFRNRPLMTDVIRVFKSSQKVLSGGDGGWTEPGSITMSDKSGGTGYSTWFLLKDHLLVGDTVRSRKPPNSYKAENMDVPEGTVVGTERDADMDGFVLVRVLGIHDPLRVPASTLERVTFGLAAGDWVRLKEEDKKHSPVGILHSINRDGNATVGFIGIETFWKGNSSEFQMANSYFVGQFVRLKANVISPRFEWPRKRRGEGGGGGAWATGKIWRILPNGCLVVKFPGRFTLGNEYIAYLADPAEVEAVSFNTCPGIVKKYQHLEDFHWAVRPLVIAFGIFSAVKLGFLAGKKVGRCKGKRQQNGFLQIDSEYDDNRSSGAHSSGRGRAWFPPAVANILGVTTSGSR